MKTLMFLLLFAFTVVCTCKAQPGVAEHLKYYNRDPKIFSSWDHHDQAAFAVAYFVYHYQPDNLSTWQERQLYLHDIELAITSIGSIVFEVHLAHKSFTRTQNIIDKIVKYHEIIGFTGWELIEKHSLYAATISFKHSGGSNKGKTAEIGLTYEIGSGKPAILLIGAFK